MLRVRIRRRRRCRVLPAPAAAAPSSLDSASSRKLARVATRSPAAMPRRITIRPALRSPVSTSRGSRSPAGSPAWAAGRSTKTILRSPESSTAESATVTASPRSTSSSTSTNIPGRSVELRIGELEARRQGARRRVERRIDVGDLRLARAPAGERQRQRRLRCRPRRSARRTRRTPPRPRRATGRSPCRAPCRARSPARATTDFEVTKPLAGTRRSIVRRGCRVRSRSARKSAETSRSSSFRRAAMSRSWPPRRTSGSSDAGESRRGVARQQVLALRREERRRIDRHRDFALAARAARWRRRSASRPSRSPCSAP